MSEPPQPALGGALRRYQVMAWVVGTGLALLVFVGIPLQLAGHPALVATVGPIHGLLYVVYLASALDLSRRARSSPLEMLAMAAAGLLPLLAFVVERHVTHRLRAAGLRSQAAEPAGR